MLLQRRHQQRQGPDAAPPSPSPSPSSSSPVRRAERDPEKGVGTQEAEMEKKTETYKRNVLESLSKHMDAFGALMRENAVLSLLGHPANRDLFGDGPSASSTGSTSSLLPTTPLAHAASVDRGAGSSPQRPLSRSGSGEKGGEEENDEEVVIIERGPSSPSAGVSGKRPRPSQQQQQQQQEQQTDDGGKRSRLDGGGGQDKKDEQGREEVAKARTAALEAKVALLENLVEERTRERDEAKEELSDQLDFAARLSSECHKHQTMVNDSLRVLLEAAVMDGAPLNGVLTVRRYGEVTEEEVRAALLGSSASSSSFSSSSAPVPVTVSKRAVREVREALDVLIRDPSLDIYQDYRYAGRVTGINFEAVRLRMASVPILRDPAKLLCNPPTAPSSSAAAGSSASSSPSSAAAAAAAVATKTPGGGAGKEATISALGRLGRLLGLEGLYGGRGEQPDEEEQQRGPREAEAVQRRLEALLIEKKTEMEEACPSAHYPTEKLWDVGNQAELPLPRALEMVVGHLASVSSVAAVASASFSCSERATRYMNRCRQAAPGAGLVGGAGAGGSSARAAGPRERVLPPLTPPPPDHHEEDEGRGALLGAGYQSSCSASSSTTSSRGRQQ